MEKYDYMKSVKEQIRKHYSGQEKRIFRLYDDSDFIDEVIDNTATIESPDYDVRAAIATNLPLLSKAYKGYDPSFLTDDMEKGDYGQIDYQIRAYLTDDALVEIVDDIIDDLRNYKSFCACEKCVHRIESRGNRLGLVETYPKEFFDFMRQTDVPEENFYCEECGEKVDLMYEVSLLDD